MATRASKRLPHRAPPFFPRRDHSPDFGRPTGARYAAVVNADEASWLAPLRDIVALGMDESTHRGNMIRVGKQHLEREPDPALEALMLASGAPEWLCELVWSEVLQDQAGALELLTRLQPAFPATPEEAMTTFAALDTPRMRAAEAGRSTARDDLQNGRCYRLTMGLVRDLPSFCPRCRTRRSTAKSWWYDAGFFTPPLNVRIAQSFARALQFAARISRNSGGPDHCWRCDTPLFHAKSVGCEVKPSTDPFIDGYRAEVDVYLRNHFPEFRWEDVDL